MKKAVVIGATGGTGAAITEELASRGIPVVAFGRSRSKLENFAARLGHPANLALAVGDAFKADDVEKASRGAEVMFHCANVPYHEMEERLIPLGEAVMEAADRLGLKVVVIDGIYPYGKRQMELVTEEHPKQPHTRKGRTRLKFAEMVFDAKWRRARPLIVRLPDYYGPTANEASYLGSTLEAIAAGKTAFFIGNMNVPREYVYLPDAAKMIAEISLRDQAYGQEWNIPGGDVISGHEIVRLAREASGSKKAVLPLGKAGLSLLGLFVPVMKEVVEMLYLTTEPLRLSGEKYERFIGPIEATGFERGISGTIGRLKK
ncbi:SDR family NAD(P)-dependent oxidoreductase [Paenibacillus sp. BK720]|uniref:SDR family NAD(P)-dependent oxidoreductase n=1 Tax=Paenibacillus sp. BK720 TaxID=2587092 RepID=UPI001423ED25|nr:SDR family NAD(P)-dependent oxidoreductase [Paenibacillus sp. BK720]NIK71338.1 nucleoside-diphosphate-sugar epimerase [Paenibacillus sp. BK720]